MKIKKKILLALLIFLIIKLIYKQCESFWTAHVQRPLKHCRYCGYNNYNSCNNCVNCGFCITSKGYGECVNGDQNGPFFRKDCLYWNYRQPAYKIIRNDDYIFRPYYNINSQSHWIKKYGNKYWRDKYGNYKHKHKYNNKNI